MGDRDVSAVLAMLGMMGSAGVRGLPFKAMRRQLRVPAVLADTLVVQGVIRLLKGAPILMGDRGRPTAGTVQRVAGEIFA